MYPLTFRETIFVIFLFTYPTLGILYERSNRDTFSKMNTEELCKFIDFKEGNVPGFTASKDYNVAELRERAFNCMLRQTKHFGV